jgi:hypothetical protein
MELYMQTKDDIQSIQNRFWNFCDSVIKEITIDTISEDHEIKATKGHKIKVIVRLESRDVDEKWKEVKITMKQCGDIFICRGWNYYPFVISNGLRIDLEDGLYTLSDDDGEDIDQRKMYSLILVSCVEIFFEISELSNS